MREFVHEWNAGIVFGGKKANNLRYTVGTLMTTKVKRSDVRIKKLDRKIKKSYEEIGYSGSNVRPGDQQFENNSKTTISVV